MRAARVAGAPSHAREAGVWLGSRLTNGLLGLLHVSLVAAAIGPDEAGRFFLLWTAAWLLATALRFGLEGILPRVVAEAQWADSEVPSLRRTAFAGFAAGALAFVPLLLTFRVPISAATAGVTAVIAICWAITFALAATLKAYGKVGLSGVVSNTIWPLGPALAPLVLLVGGGDWHDLIDVTAVATLGSLLLAYAVAAHALGRRALGRLASRRPPMLRLETDVVGAAFLSVLYELLLWLPVVVVALANVGGLVAAGVYAAVRVTGLVSWPYNAVVAVLTPRIAGALAAKDLGDARRLIVRGSLLGIAVTLPAAVVVALAARPILELFDQAYGVLAPTLALLVAGRVFDAAAGPVGESLLVGRRTWLDCALVATGVAIALILGLALEPSLGARAAGIAGAVAFTLTNLLRLGVVWRLLSTGWRAGAALPRWARRPAFPGAVLAVGITLAVAVALVGPSTRSGVWLGVAASVLAAAGAVGLGAVRHGLRAAVASPIAILALVLLAQFALRPATLALDPGSATWVVRTLGFQWSDVTQATVLGAGGLGLFAAGFLVSWRPSRSERRVPAVRTLRTIAAVAGAVALGTLLWVVLFRRLGGANALANDPSAVHLSQFGAGYGSVGLALCLGAALVGFQAWLARPGKALFVTTSAAAAVAVVGSIALATRGVLIATAVAALALFFRARRPPPRKVVAGVLCLVVVGAGALVLRAVRDYSQYEPTGEAWSSVGETPPLRLLTPDLIEFDHLVALRGLVPGHLDWLDGESLAQVPSAFVPRALWGEKPRPLDFRLSRKLWGGRPEAGTPFTLVGEMWWNLRFAGALLTLLAFGAAAGVFWRAVLVRGAAGELVTAVLTGYSYLVFTRPLGAMLLTAAVGVATALTVRLAATVHLDPAFLRTRARRVAAATAARARVIAHPPF